MNLKSQIHRISCFPYRHFECSREIFLALCSFLLLSQKVSPFPLSHIGRYTGVPERSLDFARDDDTGIVLSKHIRCTLREINPFPPPSFRAQREISLALCSFLLLSQKVSPFPLSHIGRYTGVQERSRASLGMTLRKWRFPNIPFIRNVGYPSPIPSFRAQREIFLALHTFLLLSQKDSPFPLSHIQRYTGVPERSLGSAFDDLAGKTLTQHVLSLNPRNTIPFLLVYLFPHTYNKMRETLIQSRNLISHVFSTI